MESRVESHMPRGGGSMNAKPSMFHAGLSNKFTKRHTTNFHDTTLAAASAAKARAELKMERQANAIEKQQEKIEHEMKKIEAITERLHRQQTREATRLRNRLMYAATRIQIVFRRHAARVTARRTSAAIDIQRHWRGMCGRLEAHRLAVEQAERLVDAAARVVTRSLRVYACRLFRRHELKWRAYAATTIQCLVRQHQARRRVAAVRTQRDEQARRHHAAVILQCHTRGFLTRLVYLDVLYLVCRIQSVVRGFLVRKRLQWLLSLNIHAIIALQALARGFVARQWARPLLRAHRLKLTTNSSSEQHAQSLHAEAPRRRRSIRPRVVHKDEPSIQMSTTTSQRSAKYALAMRASLPSPVAASPERIKRSYWLPSGSTTTVQSNRRRLPHLPVRALPSPDQVMDPAAMLGFGELAQRVVQVQRLAAAASRKLGKHRPPQRLEPIERSSGDEYERSPQAPTNENVDEQEAVTRRMRDEALKHKLAARKAQEKKRLQLEMAAKQEQENASTERKQMEREEKLMRLWLKTTHRKYHELKLRRQSIEQQREERERMEMIREERLTLVHLKMTKRAKRDASKRPLAVANEPQDIDADRDEDDTTRRERILPPLQLLLQPTFHDEKKMTSHPLLLNGSNNHNQHKQCASKPHHNHHQVKPSGVAMKKTRELRAVYGGGAQPANQSRSSSSTQENDLLQAQYASWDFHHDNFASFQAELVEDEAEFDYGDQFDDIEDESKLTRLLC